MKLVWFDSATARRTTLDMSRDFPFIRWDGKPISPPKRRSDKVGEEFVWDGYPILPEVDEDKIKEFLDDKLKKQTVLLRDSPDQKKIRTFNNQITRLKRQREKAPEPAVKLELTNQITQKQLKIEKEEAREFKLSTQPVFGKMFPFLNGWIWQPYNPKGILLRGQFLDICWQMIDFLDEQFARKYCELREEDNDALPKARELKDNAPAQDAVIRLGFAGPTDLTSVGNTVAKVSASWRPDQDSHSDSKVAYLRSDDRRDTFHSEEGFTYRYFEIAAIAEKSDIPETFFRGRKDLEDICPRVNAGYVVGVWIPRRVIFALRGMTPDYYYYCQSQSFIQAKLQKNVVLYLPVIAIENGSPPEPLKCLGLLPVQGMTAGGGGGGAMRADAIDEISYVWNGPLERGLALGLAEQFHGNKMVAEALKDHRKSQTPTALERVKTGSRWDNEIVYYKKFKSFGEDKKNYPRMTVPVDFEGQTKSKQFIGGLALVKKKKGDLLLSGGAVRKVETSGETLKHKNVGRESAAAIMGPGFETLGHRDQGPTPAATAVVKWVLKEDKQAREKWEVLSSKLQIVSPDNEGKLAPKTYDPKLESKTPNNDLRSQLRTDQEWCHLYGHGDGGTEEFDNFVAGSQHCNTEQLAIETGQRKGSHRDLTVKVTGYLLPNRGFDRSPGSFSLSDWRVIGSLGDTKDLNKENFEQTNGRTLLDGLLGKLAPIADFVNKKGEAGWDAMEAPALAAVRAQLLAGSQSPLVPTLLQYESYLPHDQGRYAKRLYEMVSKIAKVPYPVALQIRYKVFYKKKLIFDHLFNAQKEDFDYNEFKILKQSVERAIAVSMGEGEVFDQTFAMLVPGATQKIENNGGIEHKPDNDDEDKMVDQKPGEGAESDEAKGQPDNDDEDRMVDQKPGEWAESDEAKGQPDNDDEDKMVDRKPGEEAESNTKKRKLRDGAEGDKKKIKTAGPSKN